MEDLIQQCMKLEQRLSSYKVVGGMIPRTTQRINLANILRKVDWNTIRKIVYARENHRCKICGKGKVSLNAHEVWEYDYKGEFQRLKDIVALCRNCHMYHHLGYMIINLSFRERKNIRSHWRRVNGMLENDYYDFEEIMWDLWELRNHFWWKVVTHEGIPITKNMDIIPIIRLIHHTASKNGDEVM